MKFISWVYDEPSLPQDVLKAYGLHKKQARNTDQDETAPEPGPAPEDGASPRRGQDQSPQRRGSQPRASQAVPERRTTRRRTAELDEDDEEILIGRKKR